MSGLKAMVRRFLAMLLARNKEFYRDRGTLMWNIVFPFLVILGFSFAFSDHAQDQYKVAIYDPHPVTSVPSPDFLHFHLRQIPRRRCSSSPRSRRSAGISSTSSSRRLKSSPGRFWVNSSSPKGYFLERLVPHDIHQASGRRT